MAGLVPAIHEFLLYRSQKEDVDGRDKPGHDEEKWTHPPFFTIAFAARSFAP
jgi:hypothetical protein